MSDTDISDEVLTAYLDGELTAEERSHVAAALAVDPELMSRLEALDVPLGPLRDGFDALLAQAPANLVPAAVSQPTVFSPYLVGGGSLAAGLAIGAFLMTQLTAPAAKAPGWIDYVASYQVLYTRETLVEVNQTPENEVAELTTVAASVGRSLDMAIEVPGLDYKRAQLLGFKGKPLAQLAYLADSGVPYALCVIPKEDVAALRQMEAQGLQSATWSDGSFAYLLIGGTDAAFIAQTAAHLQSTL